MLDLSGEKTKNTKKSDIFFEINKNTAKNWVKKTAFRPKFDKKSVLGTMNSKISMLDLLRISGTYCTVVGRT